MRKLLFTAFFLLQLTGLAAQNGEVRNYFTPLTEAQKQDIRYIINTLADNSVFSLMFYKSSLEKRGNQVDNVHPLKFMGFVYSDPELRRNVKRINGMPWNRFTEGMAGSFENAYLRHNMKKEYIDDFSKQVGVKESTFIQSVDNKQWVEFMNIVRREIPN